MRKYIRHPSDIPIKFDIEGRAGNTRESLHDVSFGGLSFTSKVHIQAGVQITITIPLVKPPFESSAVIISSCSDSSP